MGDIIKGKEKETVFGKIKKFSVAVFSTMIIGTAVIIGTFNIDKGYPVINTLTNDTTWISDSTRMKPVLDSLIAKTLNIKKENNVYKIPIGFEKFAETTDINEVVKKTDSLTLLHYKVDFIDTTKEKKYAIVDKLYDDTLRAKFSKEIVSKSDKIKYRPIKYIEDSKKGFGVIYKKHDLTVWVKKYSDLKQKVDSIDVIINMDNIFAKRKYVKSYDSVIVVFSVGDKNLKKHIKDGQPIQYIQDQKLSPHHCRVYLNLKYAKKDLIKIKQWLNYNSQHYDSIYKLNIANVCEDLKISENELRGINPINVKIGKLEYIKLIKISDKKVIDKNSISSGIYTYGLDGDYATRALAYADVADTLTANLTFIRISDIFETQETLLDFNVHGKVFTDSSAINHNGKIDGGYKVYGQNANVKVKVDASQDCGCGSKIRFVNLNDVCNYEDSIPYMYNISNTNVHLIIYFKNNILNNKRISNTYNHNPIGINIKSTVLGSVYVWNNVILNMNDGIDINNITSHIENLSIYDSKRYGLNANSKVVNTKNILSICNDSADFKNVASATGYNNGSSDATVSNFGSGTKHFASLDTLDIVWSTNKNREDFLIPQIVSSDGISDSGTTTSLIIENTKGIRGNSRGTKSSVGAYESVKEVYYSVKDVFTDFKVESPNISITNSIITFSSRQDTGVAENIGIGDAVSYNSKRCFLYHYISPTQWTVIDSLGKSIPNESSTTLTSIKRVYHTLNAALAGFTGSHGINSINLVSAGVAVHLVCKSDTDGTADVTPVSINMSSYVMSETNDLTIYTPYKKIETIKSHRHLGRYTSPDSAYVLAISSNTDIIQIKYGTLFLTIDGLQIKNTVSGSDALELNSDSANTGRLNLTNNIILGPETNSSGYGLRSYYFDNIYSINNISENWSFGLVFVNGITNSYIYNNTLIDNSNNGLTVNSGTAYLNNNIALLCSGFDNGGCTYDASSSNNATTTGPNQGSVQITLTGNSRSDYFIDSLDYHIKDSIYAHEIRDTGRTIYSNIVDYENDSRPFYDVYDLGADEYTKYCSYYWITDSINGYWDNKNNWMTSSNDTGLAFPKQLDTAYFTLNKGNCIDRNNFADSVYIKSGVNFVNKIIFNQSVINGIPWEFSKSKVFFKKSATLTDVTLTNDTTFIFANTIFNDGNNENEGMIILDSSETNSYLSLFDTVYIVSNKDVNHMWTIKFYVESENWSAYGSHGFVRKFISSTPSCSTSLSTNQMCSSLRRIDTIDVRPDSGRVYLTVKQIEPYSTIMLQYVVGGYIEFANLSNFLIAVEYGSGLKIKFLACDDLLSKSPQRPWPGDYGYYSTFNCAYYEAPYVKGRKRSMYNRDGHKRNRYIK